MEKLQRITSNLWFDKNAEEAAQFYTSVFKNSRIGRKSYYGEAGKEHHQMPEGTVMTIEFWLDGHEFLGLNGGPIFQFNEAVSFVVNCDSQEEIDYYWEKLTEGGDPKAQVCGWLKDKFGLSWQVVPRRLAKMLTGEQEKAQRVMAEVMQMKKLDLDVLEKAYAA